MKAMDIGRLRLLAVMRLGWALIWLTMLASRHPAKVSGRAASLWEPLFIARWFDTPPSLHYHALIQLVSALAAVLLLFGLATRLSGGVCVASGILFVSLALSWGKVGHSTQAVLLVGLVLMMSDWGKTWSLDALIRTARGSPMRLSASQWPDWPFWSATFVLAILYANSGLHKLVRGYFLDGGFDSFLRYQLVRWSEAGNVPKWTYDNLQWVVDRPTLVTLMALGAVAFETGFLLALVSPQLRMFFLSGALAFHGSIGVLSGVYFSEPMMIALLLFVPTAILYARERRGWFTRIFPLEPALAEGARTKLPSWAPSAIAAGASLLLLLLVAPIAPGWLPLGVGRRVATTLTLHAPRAFVPVTPRAYAVVAIAGSLAAGMALLLIVMTAARSGPRVVLDRLRRS